MVIAKTVSNQLDELATQYDVLAHEVTDTIESAAASLGLDEDTVARAVVLRDEDYICMAVLPLNYMIDFADLKALTQRNLQSIPNQFVSDMFSDCEDGVIPPFGGVYNIETFYDVSLLNKPAIVLEAGSHQTMIRLTRDEFRKLVESNHRGSFAKPVSLLRYENSNHEPLLELPHAIDLGASFRHLLPVADIDTDIEKAPGMPVLSMVANNLIDLQKSGKGSIPDLLELISRDPVLTAYMIRFARSFIFNKPANLRTLDDALSRVLGFDIGLALALALSIMQPFVVQPVGPLGRKAIWKHSLLLASLTRHLADELPAKTVLDHGKLFLSSLLHNLGFILYGHLFHSKFFLLNKLVELNPQIPVMEFESLLTSNKSIGVMPVSSHAQVAAGLLESWGLAQEVVVAVRFHHDDLYEEKDSIYANLILIADHLLKAHQIGDALNDEPPQYILERLKLDLGRLEGITRQLIEDSDDLPALIQIMTSRK